MSRNRAIAVLSGWLCLAATSLALAQGQEPRPAPVNQPVQDRPQPAPAQNQAPQSQPAAQSQPADRLAPDEIVYVVESVRDAQVAPAGSDFLKRDAWKPIRQGQFIRSGSIIQTGIRGRVKLYQHPAEPPTVMLVEGSTMVQVDELHYRSEGAARAARSHLSLKVGAVRAGVAEGSVRSDMQITSPVAQLSKRGTDIFRFEYTNGRFQMSLSEKGRGLLQAMQFEWNSRNELIRTKSRFVTAGQRVTQQMFQAIDSVRFDRKIQFNDLFGISKADQEFLINNGGLALLLPVGNNTVNWLDSPVDGGIARDGTQQNPLTAPPRMRAQPRGEGNFGIGQNLLPGGLFGDRSFRRQLQDRQIRRATDGWRRQAKSQSRPRR